jgi:hypothetical protein
MRCQFFHGKLGTPQDRIHGQRAEELLNLREFLSPEKLAFSQSAKYRNRRRLGIGKMV